MRRSIISRYPRTDGTFVLDELAHQVFASPSSKATASTLKYLSPSTPTATLATLYIVVLPYTGAGSNLELSKAEISAWEDFEQLHAQRYKNY